MRPWVWALALLLLTSCAGGPKRAGRLPEQSSEALLRLVLKDLSGREASLKGLRGLATVRYGSKLWGVKGETAFAVRRPDDLRIDALSDFGSFASQVVMSRGRLLILWPSENTYFEGEADRAAMERFLLIGLDPDQAVDVLAGIVPLEPEAHYRLFRSGSEIVLSGRKGDLTLEARDGRFLPVGYVGRREDGTILYRLKYGSYTDLSGLPFAQDLRAEFRDPRSRVEIRFKEVELNPQWPQTAFQRKVPEQATPVDEAVR